MTRRESRFLRVTRAGRFNNTMASTGSKRVGAVMLAALVIAACHRSTATASGSAPPSLTPTVVPTTAAVATEVPTPSPTAEPTPELTPEPTVEPTEAPEAIAWPCPTDSPINLLELTNARLRCFGNDQIRVRAWLETGPAIGWLPPTIAPAWLVYPNVQNSDHSSFALWYKPPDNSDVICGESYCRFDWVHLPPGSTLELRGPARWVIAIGHINDPAADRCHWTWPEDWEVDPSYDDADAVAICRRAFILEAIEEIL